MVLLLLPLSGGIAKCSVSDTHMQLIIPLLIIIITAFLLWLIYNSIITQRCLSSIMTMCKVFAYMSIDRAKTA